VRIHFVIHESFELPGAFETWARTRDYSISYSRVYDHEPLPMSVLGLDLLVVLGGPQSPATTKDECPHFDAKAEIALISKAIESNKAVIGVCLGSQLIGEALGTRFEQSPQKEIGKFPITLTDEGLRNSKFAHFGRILEVGHWHSDMPGLTQDCSLVAYSEGCPRQIIEYSRLVYGFQCHMELTREVIELLIASAEHELPTLAHHKFVQQPDALRDNDYTDMNKKLFVFMDKLVQDYKARQHG
jgi:GMP synthase (glutamine-hydrolysing)